MLKIPNRIELEQISRTVIERQNSFAAELNSLGIYINFVPPIDFKGYQVFAVGSHIYNKRPLNETFHEFIIDIARLKLGRLW